MYKEPFSGSLGTLDEEATRMFVRAKKASFSLERAENERPTLTRKVNDYLGSDDFKKVSGGKSIDELRVEREDKVEVKVDTNSVVQLEHGNALPAVRFLQQDLYDQQGVRDFLGTRTNLVIIIGHSSVE